MEELVTPVLTAVSSTSVVGVIFVAVVRARMKRVLEAPDEIDALSYGLRAVQADFKRLEKQVEGNSSSVVALTKEIRNDISVLVQKISDQALQTQQAVAKSQADQKEALTSIAASIADAVSRLSYIEGALDLKHS